jgi:hypothetical protein
MRLGHIAAQVAELQLVLCPTDSIRHPSAAPTHRLTRARGRIARGLMLGMALHRSHPCRREN